MNFKIYLLMIPLFVLSLSLNLNAKPTVAFGYLRNVSNDPEFKYVEIIFPNSFANSIGAIFDVNVKKPMDIEKELRKKGSYLKNNYEFHELPDLIEAIDSNLFVFGNFAPLNNNQVKITLSIYMHGYNEIFSFTNIGKMETQISKLVDRISIVVINFMSEQNLYKIKKIEPGTRLAVLSNLEGEELNRLLIAFMEKGYPISCFQNNSIHNVIEDPMFEKFSYIRTEKNSYDVITDWRKSKFLHGTWASKRHGEAVSYLKDIYNKYDLHYDELKKGALERLNKSFNNRVDVLLIIGFSENRRETWVRAIDLREKELIWMQSNIKSGLMDLDPVMSNVNKIVDGMIAEPVNPFRETKKEAE